MADAGSGEPAADIDRRSNRALNEAQKDPPWRVCRPGQRKMLLELVNAEHHVFAGCAECRQTVTFTVPETTSRPH